MCCWHSILSAEDDHDDNIFKCTTRMQLCLFDSMIVLRLDFTKANCLNAEGSSKIAGGWRSTLCNFALSNLEGVVRC